MSAARSQYAVKRATGYSRAPQVVAPTGPIQGLRSSAKASFWNRTKSALGVGPTLHRNPAKANLIIVLEIIAKEEVARYEQAVELLKAAKKYLTPQSAAYYQAHPEARIQPDARNWAYKNIIEMYMTPLVLMNERNLLIETQIKNNAHADWPLRRMIMASLNFLRNSKVALHEFQTTARAGKASRSVFWNEMAYMAQLLQGSNQVVYDFFVDRMTSIPYEYQTDDAAPGDMTTPELLAKVLGLMKTELPNINAEDEEEDEEEQEENDEEARAYAGLSRSATVARAAGLTKSLTPSGRQPQPYSQSYSRSAYQQQEEEEEEEENDGASVYSQQSPRQRSLGLSQSATFAPRSALRAPPQQRATQRAASSGNPRSASASRSRTPGGTRRRSTKKRSTRRR